MGIFWWVVETAAFSVLTWRLLKRDWRRLALLPIALALVAACVSAGRAYQNAVKLPDGVRDRL